MARRTGTVKLSIQSSYDDKGTKQAEAALARFQRKFELAEGSQAMKLAESSVKWDQRAADIERNTARIGKAWENVGGAMTRTGDALTMGVTAPMLAAGGAAVKAAIDWETAFAGVEKTVDGTAEQMAALEQGIREMAKTLPTSREEIAGVAEAAGQLGIETDSVLDFTRVMVDLGESTNLSATDAATALARFANITQMSQDDFDKLGSAVVDLGNNMATTESEIVDMALRLAGAGKQVGMSESEILGLSAALSSVGIEAEAGGSAISKTMINIAADVEKGGEGLAKWAKTAGMSAAEFSKAWKSDPAAALNSVITGLGDMESQGVSTLGMLEELGITEVRQRDALLRLAGAGDILTGAIETSNGAWDENIALTTEAEKRYATTASQLAIAKNSVTDAAVSLGEGLAPALIDAVEAATPLIEWATEQAQAFAALDKDQQQQIIKWAAIAAAMGPVLSITGRMVSSVGGMVTSFGKSLGAIDRFIAKHLAAKAATEGASAALGTVSTAATTSAGALDVAGGAAARSGASAATASGGFKALWAAIAPIAVPLAALAGSVMAVNKSLEWQNDTLNRNAEALVRASGDIMVMKDAVDKGETSWTALAEAADKGYGALIDANTATFIAAEAAREQAGALGEANAALKTYAELTTESVDANIAAESADIALERARKRTAEAQERYNQVVAESGSASQAAQDAALDLRDAQNQEAAAARRAEDATKAANEARANIVRPVSGNLDEWLNYYQAIGDKAGYAAAKANAVNTALRKTPGGVTAKAGTGGYQIPVSAAGRVATSPMLSLLAENGYPEYVITTEPLYRSRSLDLYGQLGRELGVSNSHSVTVAPGAVQISVSGSSASPSLIAAEVEAALRRIVRSSQLIGA